jgi:hypothetical protein
VLVEAMATVQNKDLARLAESEQLPGSILRFLAL